jgi:ketosteroid isomerase-like protein
MRRPLSILAVLVFPLLGCQPGPDTTMEADTTAEDEAAIVDLVASFDAALRAEDIDAMMSRYGEASVRMNPNVPAAVGVAAIRGAFEEAWEANDFDVTNEVVELRVMNGLAAVRGTYTSHVTPADGSDPYEDVGKWSAVWQRQADGSWLALWDIWNSDLPPRLGGQ